MSPGPAPRARGHCSAPPQPPAPTLGGGVTWAPPPAARVPGRASSSSRPAPGARSRPSDPPARAPRDVTAVLIQRALRPTRVSRQRARVGAGLEPSTGAEPWELPRRGGDRARALHAARPAAPRPPASRRCAAHRPTARRGMRAAPAPGSQVSGGGGAGAPGAPATRTWLGLRRRGQGSCWRGELRPQPGRGLAPRECAPSRPRPGRSSYLRPCPLGHGGEAAAPLRPLPAVRCEGGAD